MFKRNFDERRLISFEDSGDPSGCDRAVAKELRACYAEIERQAALIERAKNVIEDLVEFGYNSGPYGYKQWLKDAEEE